MEQLDVLDRQIVAALVRNGRAPWRMIADVLGQQERTVARRGNKLLESGVVRTNSFVNPSQVSSRSAFLLRVRAVPRELRRVGSWLAAQKESSWVSVLSGANEAVAEIFIPTGELSQFLYHRMAGVDGVQSFTMVPLLEYFRTPSGWTPEVLEKSQYGALHPDEDGQLAAITLTRPGASLDETDRGIADLLHRNGRASVDEMAAELSVSKPTVSRRLEAMTNSGILFIRAVVEPAALGFPVESLISLTRTNTAADGLGKYLGSLPVTRWAAASGEQVLAQVAVPTLEELHLLLADLRKLEGITELRSSIYAEIFKRSTVIYHDGVAERP
jgi:DNA-binding Lrp family transcriptional regulator